VPPRAVESVEQPAVEPAVAPPPGNPRFPLVDGARAIAVGLVVLSHLTFLEFGGATSKLGVGVDLFFLISGFLLYRPFVAAHLVGERGPRVRDYARRRLLRIVPGYWVALTVLAIYPGLPGDPLGSHALLQYTFLQNLSRNTVLDGVGVSWSLCVEMAFYVALPLYALVLGRLVARRSGRSRVRIEYAALALVGVFGLAWQIVVYGHWGFVIAAWALLPSSLPYFAAGMALAVASAASAGAGPAPALLRPAIRHPGLAWLLALGLFLWLSLPVEDASRVFYHPDAHPLRSAAEVLKDVGLRVAIPALVLIPALFGWRDGGAPRRFLAAPRVAWVGLISYGIYLYHVPIIGIARGSHAGIGPPPQIVGDVMVVVLTLAAAAASYKLVERPLLRWKPGLGSAYAPRRRSCER
jgi:peptidoglycan/LPS O-acetylase OafA/YrhL